MHQRDTDEFFVGYSSTPAALRLWLRRAALTLGVLVAVAAVSIAALQRDPGDAIWNGEETAIEGVIVGAPFPAVFATGKIVLLVNGGKIGAGKLVADKVGKRARVHGTTLVRGDKTLMEVHRVEVIDSNGATLPAVQWSAAVRELQGEVIDPKCYSGAMKPGEGKTHKACAALCIRGGIPPVLLADEPYLLLGEKNEIARRAGEQVELKGEVGLWGNWRVFRSSRETAAPDSASK